MGLTNSCVIVAFCGIFLFLGFISNTEALQTDWECSMDVSDEMKKAANICFKKYPIEVHNEKEYFKNREGMNFTETEMNNFICIMTELGVIADPAKPVFNFDKMLEHVEKFQCDAKEKDGIKTIVSECKTEIDEVVAEHTLVRIEGILRCFVFKFHQKDICGKPEEKAT